MCEALDFIPSTGRKQGSKEARKQGRKEARKEGMDEGERSISLTL
jgi:hypothetical protein